ncbi:MAG: transporter substrate-binding domain-containing protein [Treponema sp.]|nr:transporter substrate-binding domain-containing protein [Candidatus Treponema merdequi]
MKKSFLISIAAISLLFSGCNYNKIVINTAKDLAGHTIGVQKGTTGEKYVTENVANAKIVSCRTLNDAAQELIEGNVDAIVIDEYPAVKLVNETKNLMIIKDKSFEQNSEKYSIAVKKGNTELLNSINETIQTIKANGKYEELIQAFMMPESGVEIPYIPVSESNKILKLGTNAQFAPFEYIIKKEVIGFDISLGQYIAQKENANLQIVDMNFAALFRALQSESIDFAAAAISVTPEREKEVDFSIPYFTSEQVIIIKK